MLYIFYKFKKILKDLSDIVIGTPIDKIFAIQDSIARYDKWIAFNVSIVLIGLYLVSLLTNPVSLSLMINLLYLSTR